MLVDHILTDLSRVSPYKIYGRVTAVLGILVEVGGIERELAIGSRCRVIGRTGDAVICEVVGFRAGRALLMPFGSLDGVGVGCKAELTGTEPVVYPDVSWLGRVVDGLAKPVDGGGPLRDGAVAYPYRNSPPPAHARNRVGAKLDLGVRTINTFLTCCRGQRMGIFSASGVGKSILLSMMARFTDSDVNVIGLIGERGREVQEFITDHLGAEGLARSVVVVATSDQSPLMRRQAALLTLSVAEYFRDLGKDVLCLMDSVTRFAMAQREIGLSAGEPPASKGYTPTVFAELPRLLERAGPGIGAGSITGLFTVLVEGDDHNEPISDAVRGILDGHIVLDRAIAERGRFPAINVLRSLSRTMPGCNSTEENAIVRRARASLADYEDMAEMIRLGAYREGSNEKVDQAIHHQPMLEKYLTQDMWERSDLASGYTELAEIMNVAADPAVEGEAEADPNIDADPAVADEAEADSTPLEDSTA